MSDGFGLILPPAGLDFRESCHFGSTGNATTIGSANDAVLNKFILAAPVLVAKMAVYPVAQSGNLDAGYYRLDGGTLTRLVSKGSTAVGTGSAVQELDVTDTWLPAGVILYEALAVDNNTATFRVVVAGPPALGQYGDRTLVFSSSFPLPATLTFASKGGTNRLFWIYGGS